VQRIEQLEAASPIELRDELRRILRFRLLRRNCSATRICRPVLNPSPHIEPAPERRRYRVPGHRRRDAFRDRAADFSGYGHAVVTSGSRACLFRGQCLHTRVPALVGVNADRVAVSAPRLSTPRTSRVRAVMDPWNHRRRARSAIIKPASENDAFRSRYCEHSPSSGPTPGIAHTAKLLCLAVKRQRQLDNKPVSINRSR
jgi:hypothetical protein